MNKHLHYDDIKISREWFEIGEKKNCVSSEDVAFRFVAYWIAFNGLFSRADDISEDDSEQTQIEKYIAQEYEQRLMGILDDHIMRLPEIQEFKEKPVLRGKNIPIEGKDYRNIYNPSYPYERFMDGRSEEERLIGLLLMIKQVRNNLFHGEKTPYPERNYKLVDGSQKILAIVLKALINDER